MTRCTAAFLCKTEQRRDRSCPPSAWTKRPCGNLSQEPCVSVAEGEGCEPPEGLNGFQARRIQPLCLPYFIVLFVGSGPSFRTRCTSTRACTSRALRRVCIAAVRPLRPSPEHKKAPAAICRRSLVFLWRKERDLNPRRYDPQRFSRPPHSAALPSFLIGLFVCFGPSAQDTLYGRRACTSRGLLTAEVNSACAPLAARPPEGWPGAPER